MIGKMVLHYKVESRLGEGGMSTVFKGVNTKLGNPVAIKVLHPHYARDPRVRERFESEAKLQARLSHPNIVTVYDFHAEGDQLFIIMEYVDGRSLAEMISEETGPLPFSMILEIMRQTLRALDFAHEQGVIHRDLKPSNIMIQRLKGQIVAKVMDFGIAKIVGESKAKTSTGTRMGTLYYMSPEQLRSAKDVDHRSDLYSMGVSLYQMATGQVPFDRDSDYALMNAIVNEKPPAPSTVYPGVMPGLDLIIMRALAKNPNERYQDASDFLADLEALAQGQAPRPTPIPILPSPTASPAVKAAAVSSATSSTSRLVPILAGILGGLFILVIALAVILYLKPPARPPAPPKPPITTIVSNSSVPSYSPPPSSPPPPSSAPTTYASGDPLQTIREYFGLINNHECYSLPRLREPCGDKVIRACQTTSWIKIDNMNLIQNDGYKAVAIVDNHGETTDGRINYFRVKITLANTSSGWKIVRLENY